MSTPRWRARDSARRAPGRAGGARIAGVESRRGHALAGQPAQVSPAGRSRQAQQAIQDAIKELILAEGLVTGDPMPTEAELMERLGISRNSVREALKALQAVDIVEVRHGFGTYVGDCSLDPFADALAFRGRMSLRTDKHDLYEIMDLRQALEAGLIGQLIHVVTDDQLALLKVRLDELVAHSAQGEAGDRADRAFHEQLFAPLGSQLMSQLLRVFWDVYHDLNRELAPDVLDPAQIADVHRAIYLAVAARDSEAAVAAMHDHFTGIRERIRDQREA
ncbi:MAG: FadR family transcriptional regulator [Jatrophihabitans sp.]|nr:MAG: FadR family transcriptional regulator [Jatrophihabitans sp.]